MINPQTLAPAELLAQTLPRNVALMPVPESPVDLITRACVEPDIKGEGLTTSMEYLVDAASRTFTPGAGADSDTHDTRLDQLADMAAKALLEQMSYTRNTVIPLVGTVADDVKSVIEAVKPRLYEIKPLRPAKIYCDPVLGDAVGKYAETQTVPFNKMSVFPAREEKEVMELMVTGVGRLDELLTALLADHDAGWLPQLYNAVFAGGVGVPDSFVPPFDLEGSQLIVNTRDITDADAVVACYFIARGLQELPPAGLNLTLEEFRAGISCYIEQYGVAVCRMLGFYKRYETQNRVVIRMPLGKMDLVRESDRRSISVYEPTYARFLNNGGSAELVIGNIFGKRDLFGAAIVENASENQALYDQYLRRQEQALVANKSATIREAILVSVGKAIQELPNEALPPNIPRADILDAVSAYIQQLESSVVEEFYPVIRWAICNLVFPHRKAYLILLGIDQKMADDPAMEPRRAAYLTALDLLAAWALSQTRAVKVATDD